MVSCTQVMLPYYTSLPPEALEGLEHVVDFDCPKGEEWDGEMRHMTLRTSVHRARIDGIPVLLVAPANRNECNIFRGDRIYGGSYNELEAYLYFSRCVRQDALRRDFLPPTARRAAATGILRCPWHEARNAWLLVRACGYMQWPLILCAMCSSAHVRQRLGALGLRFGMA